MPWGRHARITSAGGEIIFSNKKIAYGSIVSQGLQIARLCACLVRDSIALQQRIRLATALLVPIERGNRE